MITVTPKQSTGVFLNPGKGWFLLNFRGSATDYSEETLALCAVGYQRFNWCDIEPEESKFRWELIDSGIEAWANLEKQYAFGIMPLNSSSPIKYKTPKWVFDAGAKYRTVTLDMHARGEHTVPVFDDPVFLEKLRNFITAMGKRYDGNPHIAFIDIRSFGNWGEGHMFPFGDGYISSEKLKEHIQIHLDAFKKTPMVLLWGVPRYNEVYDWAVEQGIGIRRDGICGNSDGSETVRAFGKTLAVFEFFGDYDFLKERGWWEGYSKDGRKGYGYRLIDCVERGKPSYIGMDGRSGVESAEKFLKAERPLIEHLANRMGYHFVLTKAVIPSTLRLGVTNVLELEWQNKGVAPIYLPCKVAVALLDEKKNVHEVCWLDELKPSRWMPDETVVEKAKILLNKVKPGSYQLAIGLFKNSSDKNPAYKLGIEGGTDTGWCLLAQVNIEK